ncbi:hypothetical protein Q5P01_023540 [Channa striata]|uniref:Uncharacterized protein n=1 Tax=Channa striata TaxID=64152 RepID=A0AA88LR06_CHASR|nr:hypothetical protein Q5P01_023540 [Channa striata]
MGVATREQWYVLEPHVIVVDWIKKYGECRKRSGVSRTRCHLLSGQSDLCFPLQEEQTSWRMNLCLAWRRTGVPRDPLSKEEHPTSVHPLSVMATAAMMMMTTSSALSWRTHPKQSVST